MSAYINIATKEYPIFEGDIRILFPNIGEKFICPEGYALVQETEKPETDNPDMKYVLGEPKKVDGVWYRTWVLEELTTIEKLMQDTHPGDTDTVQWYWDNDDRKWLTEEQMTEKLTPKEVLNSSSTDQNGFSVNITPLG